MVVGSPVSIFSTPVVYEMNVTVIHNRDRVRTPHSAVYVPIGSLNLKPTQRTPMSESVHVGLSID
jgi:hypothetical protein